MNNMMNYEIIVKKEIDINNFPSVWSKNFDGKTSSQLIRTNSYTVAKEQYDKYQIGDIVRYDSSVREYIVVPMTPDILNILISEKSSFPYHLLKEEYRNDPKILNSVLNSFDPYSGVCADVYNPISYALPNALTEENIQLAISKVRPIEIIKDKNGETVKKAILDYLRRNYSLSEDEYNSIENNANRDGFFTGLYYELQEKQPRKR